MKIAWRCRTDERTFSVLVIIPAHVESPPTSDIHAQVGHRLLVFVLQRAATARCSRYQKKDLLPEREQYQLFDSSQYIYRVFVTNMKRPIDLLAWFYNQRAGAENLIKEANNDAGLAAHPSGRWATNCVHFQLAMLAYNLNCWLLLFQRDETAKVAELKHTTLAIARLRFLFLAAKVWRHAGRVGVSYSDQYAERGLFQRLMDRLRRIAPGQHSFPPVLVIPLRS